VALPYKIPGIYREDVYARPAPALPTGVPGFVGFAKAARPVLLHRAEELAALEPAARGYLADAVAGFFANGGVRCYVIGAAASNDQEQALTDAIELLGPLADLDLVAVPDAMTLPEDAAQRLQSAALAHCSRHGNRFAILDAPGGKDPNDANAVDALQAWRRRLMLGDAQPANAALYYPWIKVASADAIGGRPVPPCGHVAGIFARSDERIGVFKAPANEELIGVLDVEYLVDAATQERLNPEGINCLRALSGRGLRVWGARTLSPDPNWLYINVRRLVLTLARWIDRNMGWAAFEANTARLWNRIQRELNVYLARLWQAGAIKGASAAEAFYVKCDSETNPADEREQGRVTTEIGLAPASPAEFVVVRVVHRPGAAQLS
jgi:phage tail sheath protein FI